MSDIKLINIGFGNMVAANRLLAVVAPDAAPVKRVIQEAREKGFLLDASCGRRTRAVLLCDSGHVVLSALLPSTISNRLKNHEEDATGEIPMELEESQ